MAGAGFEIGQLFDRTDRNPSALVLQADGGQVLLPCLVEVGVTEFCVDLAEGEAHRRQALPCIGTGLQRRVDGTRQFTAPLGRRWIPTRRFCGQFPEPLHQLLLGHGFPAFHRYGVGAVAQGIDHEAGIPVSLVGTPCVEAGELLVGA